MSNFCDLLLIFSFILIAINHATSLSYNFWMKKVNNFQIATPQPRGVAYISLNFSPILAWRCM